MNDAIHKAEILIEALGYFRTFHGKVTVIKLGGSAMEDAAALHSTLQDVVFLSTVGMRPILVHGGGPEIDKWLERLGIEKKTLNGLRVTDDETMEVVEMALAGRANKALVAEIAKADEVAARNLPPECAHWLKTGELPK